MGTWNVAWKKPTGRAGSIMRERLLESDPEVLCITEADAGFLGSAGHTISANADYGYPIIDGRRKVLLWSRNPWEDIDVIGHEEMPSGRFVSGRTRTSAGDMLFIGVCIPWAAAHVSTGRGDRKRWEEHLSYLTGLKRFISRTSAPFIIMGDFNQAIPRRRAPAHVFDALRQSVLGQARVFTTGEIAGHGFAIDHIGASQGIGCTAVSALSAFSDEGTRLSDHFGLLADLEFQNR